TGTSNGETIFTSVRGISEKFKNSDAKSDD
ncbi:hypothetical protein Tco_0051773, partial [Tanacetum coccineum]